VLRSEDRKPCRGGVRGADECVAESSNVMVAALIEVQRAPLLH
jgi:hypothetical protein